MGIKRKIVGCIGGFVVCFGGCFEEVESGRSLIA
jgi:hypothetical protein